MQTSWLTRRWKVSQKGNPNLRADGYRVTVDPRGGGRAYTLAPVAELERVIHARRNRVDLGRAQLAAFDHITRLLA